MTELEMSAAPPPSLKENELEPSSKRRTRSSFLSLDCKLPAAGGHCKFLSGVMSIGSSSPKYIESIRLVSNYLGQGGVKNRMIVIEISLNLKTY